MKKINGLILKARMDDKQQLIREACYLENLQTQGKTPESVMSSAREFLSLDEGASIIAENQEIVKKYNFTVNGLNKLNGALVELDGNLDEEEKVFLENLHNKLAKNVCSLYDIEEEELFKQES